MKTNNKITIVVLCGILFSLGIFTPQLADAKEFYPSTTFRLNEPPTFCTSTVPNSMPYSSDWIEQVKNSINDWEIKLQEDSDYPEFWEMNFKQVSDISNPPDDCTIPIALEYESDYWSSTLGVFKWFDDPKIEIYAKSFSCEIECDDWNPVERIHKTLVHEIGHSFGLGHFVYDDEDKNERIYEGRRDSPSIMFPYSGRLMVDSEITKIDISKTNQLYGTYGFFAFSEEKPEGIIDPDTKIIEGIAAPSRSSIINTEISDSQILEILNKYDSVFITVSGNIHPDLLLSGQNVRLFMTKPDMSMEVFQISPTRSGYFELMLQITNDYKKGVYTIEPEYLQTTYHEFEVQFEIVDELSEKKSVEKEEQIDEDFSFNYDIHLDAGVLYLSKTSDNIVSGYLTQKDGSGTPTDEITLYIYLILHDSELLKHFPAASTIVKNDLKFSFDISTEEMKTQFDIAQTNDPIYFVFVSPLSNIFTSDFTEIPLSEGSIIEWGGFSIPSWVKNNAGWWATDQISNDDFFKTISYLIEKGILIIPPTEQESNSAEVPAWVKNNAGWWADGAIDDKTFVSGLQFLVKSGIIVVS